MDSHSTFIAGWDTELLRNWLAAKNSKAILTTYPKSVGSIRSYQSKFPFEWKKEDERGSFKGNFKDIHGIELPVRHGIDPNLILAPMAVPVICGGRFLEVHEAERGRIIYIYISVCSGIC